MTSPLRFFSVLALLGVAAACGGGDSDAEGAAAPLTPGQELCQSIAKSVSSCGMATACDKSMVADCASVVDLLAEPYLKAVRECVDGGGSTAGCFASSLSGLTPSAAHQSFATTFCDKCVGGVISGCEGVFYSPTSSVPDELKVAGKLILPMSDSVVDELKTECASGSALTCTAQFTSCFQGVIAKRAVPKETAKCLLDSLTSGDSGGGGCGAAGSAGASGSGGAGNGGSGGAGKGGSGGSSDAGKAGAAGSAGTSGSGGSGAGAGNAGKAGMGGSAGKAGMGGTAGKAGMGGAAGASGTGGAAGTGSGGGSGAAGGAGASGACAGTEPNDAPNTAVALTTVGDCSADKTLSAGLSGAADVDFYAFDGTDDACVVNPAASTSAKVRLCMYATCPGIALSCTTGTPSSVGTLDGCCTGPSGGDVALSIDCNGISDDAKVYLRVDGGTAGECRAYSVTYTY